MYFVEADKQSRPLVNFERVAVLGFWDRLSEWMQLEVLASHDKEVWSAEAFNEP